MAFDTLSYARKLRQAGVPEAQAETMADAARDLIDSDMASKGDITGVRNELALFKSDVAAMEARIMAALEAQSLRLTIRLGDLIAIGVGILAAIIKL
jgi:hypothetical protein